MVTIDSGLSDYSYHYDKFSCMKIIDDSYAHHGSLVYSS